MKKFRREGKFYINSTNNFNVGITESFDTFLLFVTFKYKALPLETTGKKIRLPSSLLTGEERGKKSHDAKCILQLHTLSEVRVNFYWILKIQLT